MNNHRTQSNFSSQPSARRSPQHMRATYYRGMRWTVLLLCGLCSTAMAQPRAAPMTWATFSTPAKTVQGGNINGFSYSEKPGDVAVAPLNVVASMLFVRGNFVAKNSSAWSGLGVSIEPGSNQPVDASSYKTLSIRLSALNGTRLRLRLTGTDEKIKSSGCYPVFTEIVTSEERNYEIALNKFASEAYCGGNAVDVAKTLQRLAAIEVTDTNDTTKARSSQFTVASITLLP